MRREGWQTTTLGEVCAFDKAQGIHRGLPYVGLEHIESHTARFIGSSEPQSVKSSTFRFSERHVLYGRLRPYLNKALAPGFEGHCSTEIFPLKPKPELSREYLLFWLLADETCDRINATCTGARMPRAQMNDVLGFEIPLPPVNEQHRIVGLLGEAFEGLASAKATAEKNLHNARALFESHLQSVFTQRGPGWGDRQLASLCHEITVGHVGSMKAEYKESGIPFLRSQNIRPFEVSMDNAVFIDEAFHRALKKSQLRSGDLAIVRTGYPGTAAVIPPELPDSNCSDLVIVRPSKDVSPHFLAAFFNSAFGKQLVLGKIVGAAQKHFNISAAKEVMLHVPPIPEQRTILAVVDNLREETQRLARVYERKLAALEALKKSLLHQAFTGAL
jgi:type I restriction enzyme, S subunit